MEIKSTLTNRLGQVLKDSKLRTFYLKNLKSCRDSWLATKK